LATKQKAYIPLAKYPPVFEDLTLIVPPETYLGPLIHSIEASSSLIKDVKIIDSFDCSRTFRITYQHPKRNLTLSEVKKIREKIIKKSKERFAVKVKQ